MNRTDSPKKQPIVFGVNGQREDLPDTTTPGDNTASYNSGFPPITMTLKSAGGLPPKGQDMNQILYELSAIGRWLSAGAINSFDATFATAIGGYPAGSEVLSDDGLKIFINTINGNTSNPNSGGSGWIDLLSYLKVRESSTGVVGESRNARMSIPSAAASSTFSADTVVVAESLTGKQYRLSSVSKTINVATTGAGGMDTGSAPASGFVGLYVIYNPTTDTSAMLAVNATASVVGEIYGGANMPSGYTASALVGVIPTNSSSQMIIGLLTGRTFSFVSVSPMSTTTATSGWTLANIASTVPKNTKQIKGTFNVSAQTGQSVTVCGVAGSSTGIGSFFGGSVVSSQLQYVLDLVSAQSVYYQAQVSGGTIGATLAVGAYTI